MANDAPTCPRCRGTGIAHSAPYLMGLRDGDQILVDIDHPSTHQEN